MNATMKAAPEFLLATIKIVINNNINNHNNKLNQNKH